MANTALISRESSRDDNDTRKQDEAGPVVPFTRASRHRTEQALDDVVTPGASAVSRGPLDVPAIGFLRYLAIEVRATGGDAAGSNAVAADDGPFSIFDELQLADVNGNPIYGPVSGYHAYLIDKYGAYRFVCDAKLRPSWSDIDNDGNFSFTILIPVEISPRDGLGALANMNASQTYKLRYSIAPASNVYATQPNTLPEVRVRAWLEAWAQPRDTSPRGHPQETKPPAHGTTQYWQPSHYTLNGGDQTIRHSRVGNMIRNLVAIVRDDDGDRDTGLFPDPVRVEYDGSLLESVSRDLIRDRMAEQHDLTGTEDAAGGLDAGVFVWNFAHDLDGRAGHEMRDQYLLTSQATRLDIRGIFHNDAATLTILTNDIAAPSGRSVWES